MQICHLWEILMTKKRKPNNIANNMAMAEATVLSSSCKVPGKHQSHMHDKQDLQPP